ncbi:hypothetical protein B0O99DRAFT_642339 [Bisporella sp. PMI_857]|nr:hypothetical protein B0O99DRAFT_642339 [Bisporella sp. PMI_857]
MSWNTNRLTSYSGCMNVPEDVINRITIPTDPKEKFVYHSKWLTAAALTQTYGYMIENGLDSPREIAKPEAEAPPSQPQGILPHSF